MIPVITDLTRIATQLIVALVVGIALVLLSLTALSGGFENMNKRMYSEPEEIDADT